MAKKKATHALYDVDPVAITIVKKGANRQRIFLKKSAADDDLLTAPATHRILKDAGDDWSVFYCVVAEPGALEDPGVGDGAGEDIVDVWKSEDEIRKAAHRFARNKGYVNAVHDGFAEQGCTVVENAVALETFTVGGQEIKKGSWYLAIEPSPEFKAQVDAGEITGVSMEGLGRREIIEKDGAITTATAGPGLLSPGMTSRVKRLRTRGKTHKEIMDATGLTHGQVRSHLAKAVDPDAEAAETRGLLRKLAGKVGITDDDELLPLAKFDSPTFGEIMASNALYDQLPDAICALQSSIYQALTDDDSDDGDSGPDDAVATVAASIDQFKTWATALVGQLEAGEPQAIAKALGDRPGTLDRKTNEEDNVVDNERAEKIEKSLSDLEGKVDALVTGLAPLAERLKDADTTAAPDAGELKKSLDTFVESTNDTLSKLEKSIDRLAEGNSSQAEDLRKSKSNSNPLAGLLD